MPSAWAYRIQLDDHPIPKRGCGMAFFDGRLWLFGGHGKLSSGPTQPGAEYVATGDDSVWTNELHVYDLSEGEGL